MSHFIYWILVASDVLSSRDISHILCVAYASMTISTRFAQTFFIWNLTLGQVCGCLFAWITKRCGASYHWIPAFAGMTEFNITTPHPSLVFQISNYAGRNNTLLKY